MLIPIGTDRPNKRRPVVNEALIAINLIIYLIGVAGYYFDLFDYGAIQHWGHYDPRDFRPWQLITYQFMHDPQSIMHILFNMIFLFVFGNAVEDRLRHVGYLAFYLMAGIVAGIVHGMTSGAPIIGASGSIAGVSGAFLALFPRSRVKIIFFIFGIYMIPALWLIGLYFMLDFVKQIWAFGGRADASRVAYMAHIAGYVYGFFFCFALLGLGILKREEFDVFFLFKQLRRRRAFRAATRTSQQVWDEPRADSAEQISRRKAPKALSEDQLKYAAERSEISQLLTEHENSQAAAKYRDLLRRAPEAVMPEQRQLDLANQLYQEGDVETATQAYELLLRQYPACRECSRVKLILGLIYTRRSRNEERAKELLEDVRPRLSTDERALADELLGELA